MNSSYGADGAGQEAQAEAWRPVAPIARTVVLPRLYTGETMILPVERRFLRLRVTAGPDAGRTFSIGSSGGEIGRRPDAEVVLTDPAVSRRHARLEFAEGAFQLVDDGSANGSFVNGDRIERAALNHGDVITLGHNSVIAEIATLD